MPSSAARGCSTASCPSSLRVPHARRAHRDAEPTSVKVTAGAARKACTLVFRGNLRHCSPLRALTVPVHLGPQSSGAACSARCPLLFGRPTALRNLAHRLPLTEVWPPARLICQIIDCIGVRSLLLTLTREQRITLPNDARARQCMDGHGERERGGKRHCRTLSRIFRRMVRTTSRWCSST